MNKTIDGNLFKLLFHRRIDEMLKRIYIKSGRSDYRTRLLLKEIFQYTYNINGLRMRKSNENYFSHNFRVSIGGSYKCLQIIKNYEKNYNERMRNSYSDELCQ